MQRLSTELLAVREQHTHTQRHVETLTSKDGEVQDKARPQLRNHCVLFVAIIWVFLQIAEVLLVLEDVKSQASEGVQEISSAFSTSFRALHELQAQFVVRWRVIGSVCGSELLISVCASGEEGRAHRGA